MSGKRKSWIQKLRDQLKYQPAPIQPARPRLVGCLTCSPVPETILRQKYEPHVCGSIEVVEERAVFSAIDRPGMSVGRLAREFCTDPHSRYFLKVSKPLHGETYEWDLARGRWVLVGQDLGYA